MLVVKWYEYVADERNAQQAGDPEKPKLWSEKVDFSWLPHQRYGRQKAGTTGRRHRRKNYLKVCQRNS